MRLQQMKEVICVTPPTASWMSERDREAATGAHPKNDPNTLLAPCLGKDKGKMDPRILANIYTGAGMIYEYQYNVTRKQTTTTSRQGPSLLTRAYNSCVASTLYPWRLAKILDMEKDTVYATILMITESTNTAGISPTGGGVGVGILEGE